MDLRRRVVLLVYNPAKLSFMPINAALSAFLVRRGLRAVAIKWGARPLPSDFLSSVCAVVTFGGDGTVLDAQRQLRGRDIPLVTLNLGRVGFLAFFKLKDWELALSRLLSEDATFSSRALGHIVIARESKVLYQGYFLNDVILKATTARGALRLSTSIWSTGEDVGTFYGDGLIFSTATGSTGYSFSAGGPALWPSLTQLLLTPLSPIGRRSAVQVFPQGISLDARVLPIHGALKASVIIDGLCEIPLRSGDRALVKVSSHRARLLTPEGWSFHRPLAHLISGEEDA